MNALIRLILIIPLLIPNLVYTWDFEAGAGDWDPWDLDGVLDAAELSSAYAYSGSQSYYLHGTAIHASDRVGLIISSDLGVLPAETSSFTVWYRAMQHEGWVTVGMDMTCGGAPQTHTQTVGLSEGEYEWNDVSVYADSNHADCVVVNLWVYSTYSVNWTGGAWGVYYDDLSASWLESSPATLTPTLAPITTATPRTTATPACVQASRTITPSPRATASAAVITATPTRTATGTLPTPTRTPTGTPDQTYDSGLADFATGLEPWSAGCCGSPPATWTADEGGGAAFLPYGAAPYTITGTVPITVNIAVLPATQLEYGVLGGLPNPVHLTGFVKGSIYDSEHAYLQAWWFHMGHNEYVRIGQVEAGSGWSNFDFTLDTSSITPDADGQVYIRTITLVAFAIDGDTYPSDDGNTITDTTRGLYLDSLRIWSGQAALPSGGSYPTCPGSGEWGSTTGTQQCTIDLVTVDVAQECIQPESLLQIGDWIAYLWCRLDAYFSFRSENSDQIWAIMDRMAHKEPMASVGEAEAIVVAIGVWLNDLQAATRPQPQTPLDFAKDFFNGKALDNVHLNFEVMTTPNLAYMAQCPSEIVAMSSVASRGSCYVVYLLRDSILVRILQWGLNLIPWIVLIRWVIRTLERLARQG